MKNERQTGIEYCVCDMRDWEPESKEEDPEHKTNMKVHYSSDRQEWCTPRVIIDAVIEAIGRIDIDPCSNTFGDPNVPARTHYNELDSGLDKEWRGTVYMNPPYGNELSDWSDN